MALAAEYRTARREEEIARLRRVVALRAMAAAGMSQRQIAQELGISQPAVSQQLKAARVVEQTHPEVLIEAAAPILRSLAEERGFRRVAVFGSVARRAARPDSDIDLLVEAPAGASTFDLITFRMLIEQILGRSVDLIDYGGLKTAVDDDIRRDAVLL